MRKIFVAMSIITLSVYVLACKSEQKIPPENEIRTVYQCPMHPEVIQEKQGKCPDCGMNLEPVKMIYKNGKWVPLENKKMEGENMMKGQMEHKEKGY